MRFRKWWGEEGDAFVAWGGNGCIPERVPNLNGPRWGCGARGGCARTPERGGQGCFVLASSRKPSIFWRPACSIRPDKESPCALWRITRLSDSLRGRGVRAAEPTYRERARKAGKNLGHRTGGTQTPAAAWAPATRSFTPRPQCIAYVCKCAACPVCRAACWKSMAAGLTVRP